ncbi:MAG: hypothetical protein KIT69_21425, partial [Propionibacteriaceae bacterium]|nr:hypothetical protein [Propionibacteriaceae bacterium]
MSAPDLRAALSALDAAARAAGVDPVAAAEDAKALSAAVSESNRGAYLAWCEAFGLTPSATPFFDAASKGRRYRGLPTPTASHAATMGGKRAAAYRQALVDVCTSAALLGEPGPAAMGAAQLAGAAQLGSPPPRQAPTLPAVPQDTAQQDFARQAPAILADVLARLGESQQRMLDLNRADPLTPGAIPGLPGSSLPTPTLSGPAPIPSAAPSATAPVASAEPETPAEPEPEQPKKSVEEWLAELDELIGLGSVKSEIHRQTAILRVDAL